MVTCDELTTTSFSSCKYLLDNIVLKVLTWVVGVSSFIGNAVVLAVRSRRYRCLKTDLARVNAMMILSLATADILNGSYLIIIGGADLRFGDQFYAHADSWFGSPACLTAGFLATLSSEMSVLMLTLISLDRYLAVVFPFNRGRRMGIKSAAIAIGVIWAVAIFVCSIPFIFEMTFPEFYGTTDVCVGLPVGLHIYSRPGGELEVEGPSWNLGIALYVGVNLVCLFIIFVCYAGIFVSVRRSAKKSKRSADQLREIHLAGRMAVIVCTDFMAWFPIVVMFLLVLCNVWSMPQTVYAFIVVFLLPLNSALNPYIYTFTQIIADKRKGRRSSLPSTSLTGISVEQKS
ncbi:relaxin receptor 2-like [Diadema setosum]|uniref:relaxin receptor 2-like n=1 Tax=Diadema setosum TaxID=31175 RepID=UPI003B3A4A5A